MVEMGEEIIVLDEVYKIFGPQPRAAPRPSTPATSWRRWAEWRTS